MLVQTLSGAHPANLEQITYLADSAARLESERLQILYKTIVDAVQLRLDDFARTRGYDNMLSLCTYATSTNPKFAAEGQYGVTARDATWDMCYGILADIQSETRPIPSGYEEIEPELPPLAWPDETE